jgi:hypothetical protein
MFKIASYCEEASAGAGTTEAQYKAALQLVREALTDLNRVDVRVIEITKDPAFYPWHRLKLINAPAVTYRAILEITPQNVTLHVVLPRNSQTYEEVRGLWEQYRTPKQP